MRRCFSLVTASCLLLMAAAWASAQTLPTDPALVTGQLDNGLRYIVRQHAYPPGRAAIWLHIHSGSLNETDPQRGLAHYLEHMAFNGRRISTRLGGAVLSITGHDVRPRSERVYQF